MNDDQGNAVLQMYGDVNALCADVVLLCTSIYHTLDEGDAKEFKTIINAVGKKGALIIKDSAVRPKPTDGTLN